MPEQVADRLKAYIQEKGLREQDRVFNLSYATARKMINKLGQKVGIKVSERVRPQDVVYKVVGE